MRKVRIPAALRRIVIARAKGCCEYCLSQARFSPSPFAGEHIFPFDLGGQTVSENLALACFGCNGHKYAKISAIDPETNLEVPLFHPRQHRWHDHFTWNEEFTHMIGLTPIGRATIQALQLNREELINLRYVLYLVGQHPPVI